jgi:hypothetical protein
LKSTQRGRAATKGNTFETQRGRAATKGNTFETQRNRVSGGSKSQNLPQRHGDTEATETAKELF